MKDLVDIFNEEHYDTLDGVICPAYEWCEYGIHSNDPCCHANYINCDEYKKLIKPHITGNIEEDDGECI